MKIYQRSFSHLHRLVVLAKISWGDGRGESLSYAFEKITCVAEWLVGNETERYAINDLVVAFLHF